MGRRRRFNPAVLQMLQRKRAEKRAIAKNTSHFAHGSKRWANSTVGPQNHDKDAAPSGKAYLFTDQLDADLKPATVPAPASMTTLPEPLARRIIGIYAALHAEAQPTKKQGKSRRKKAATINASRLKLAVQRVSKVSATNAPPKVVDVLDDHGSDIWLGTLNQRHRFTAPDTQR